MEDQGLERSGEAAASRSITPNPKTSGGARWAYLAAWAYAAKAPGGNADKAKAFVGDLYHHVPVLDTGARGSTTTFAQRGIGDVLLSWENEAHLAFRANSARTNSRSSIRPSSILAEPPVALIDKNVDRHGTRKVAEAYLQFLYTKEAQEIEAKNFYRPRDQDILARTCQGFPGHQALYVSMTSSAAGRRRRPTHFADGGVFDQIYKPGQ